MPCAFPSILFLNALFTSTMFSNKIMLYDVVTFSPCNKLISVTGAACL